ncbi:sensor histidine kinase [Sphingomonas flavalba]|uniref:sensor histidine kinase n=1 Tax=Sphingomonas flavalba TaxID=2559804 RepID=UPI0014455784|nr:sensor histidine kinase [Sphingomonas flavalba]
MVSPGPDSSAGLRTEASAASGSAGTPAHYQTTFKFAGVGLARVSLDGAFVDVNQRLCDMIGYSREALLGSRFQDITHPDDLGKNEDYLGKVMSGELDSYRFEKRYIKANGEILWADLTATLERDAQGRPFEMISIVADIGAFKIAEERMNFLIGELAHRSKNLFAVVLSVINQIGGSARTVPAFQQELEQRIRGLAVSQDLMLGNAGHISSLHDLARQQLRAFVEPADPRVGYAGQSPVLGRNATRVLGMALHELATNACKYGALTSADGRLAIDCELEDGPDPVAIIRWTERDGPPVAAPSRSGFGRKVIERMVARSLNAEVDLRFDRRGVEWRCRVRLADLSR